MTHKVQILDTAKNWLCDTFDAASHENGSRFNKLTYIRLENRFSKNLEFTTIAMRGINSVGKNRINKYKPSRNTQGLSNYLYSCFPKQTIKDTLAMIVVIIYSESEFKKFISFSIERYQSLFSEVLKKTFFC